MILGPGERRMLAKIGEGGMRNWLSTHLGPMSTETAENTTTWEHLDTAMRLGDVAIYMVREEMRVAD
jgi:hypothetical protein